MTPKDYIFNPERNPLIRGDYRPSEYVIDKAHLDVALDDEKTVITNRFSVARNPQLAALGGPLILQGEDVKLSGVKILENGAFRALDPQEFTVDETQLVIKRPPAGRFELEIETEVNPAANTKLSGLYKAGDILVSQNEAQGFRRMTYFLDRPDNLAVFTARLEADKKRFPVLLSNGNGDPLATTDVGNGRHAIEWQDPWPKPSYLYCVVAGDLRILHDTFTTMSGKKVDLRVFVQPEYEGQVEWAMRAIKRAMRWDEIRYGREYDLDCFHVVAVDKFNAGAMENKGLNVFNVMNLVGSPETRTDAQLMRIEEVIGHEYFHNYTGDRVTVRDWFEISLKESLTSLRQSQFIGDLYSRAVKTIDDATELRAGQFLEDAGPTAHPVRPERVEEFDNIYSTTVYGKGKQVLNMMNTILGDGLWRKAMDNYFVKFDGKAVTVDDFIDNMQDVSGTDLTQFRRWYSQSGTPEISYAGKYDPAAKTYTLTLTQNTPATADQPASDKKDLHIPVSVGLVSESGKDVPLVLSGEGQDKAAGTRVLNLTQKTQTFVFENVSGPVVPSILRNFSAPVKITTQPTDEELIFRMAHDSDPFNRFEATQRLMLKTLGDLAKNVQEGRPLALPADFTAAYGANLANALDGDASFAARLLTLPAYNILIQGMKTVDPDAARAAVKFMGKALAETFQEEFRQLYQDTTAPAGEKYDVVQAQVGRRELHNLSLSYLGRLETPEAVALAQAQYASATNMTEKLGAASTLARMDKPEGQAALDSFYHAYKKDNTLVDSWLQLQAQRTDGDPAARVRGLLKHEAFDITNPNKVRALLLQGFANANPAGFHAKDGAGYKLLADVVVEMNKINPRTAAQIVRPLAQFKRYDAERQALMLGELRRIYDTPGLDRGIKEVVGQSLATAEKPATAGKPGGPKVK
jgi:aminopeptidase N